MTTINRETLELAALAAGMTPVRMSDDGRGLLVAERREPWRPHTDFADAARLAVRRRFWVRVDHAAAEVVDVDGAIITQVLHNDTDADAERAYCEAVTLGAAHEGRWIRDNRTEIGRRMREGGQ